MKQFLSSAAALTVVVAMSSPVFAGGKSGGGHSGGHSSGHHTSSQHGSQVHSGSHTRDKNMNGKSAHDKKFLGKNGKPYYKGKHHHHWRTYRWDARYGCYCYWDDSSDCYFYYCQPDDCYYPLDYCPYGTYSWEDNE